MAITLRIVGIFYSTTVDLGASGGTVKEVLDAAANAPSAGQHFGYAPRVGSPRTFAMYSESSFPSPTPGLGMTYPSGYYAQSESFSHINNPNPYSVWQYYIFDANNVYLNRGKGAIPFDEAHVPGDGSVIWRLVSVLSGPVEPSGKLLKTLGLPLPSV